MSARSSYLSQVQTGRSATIVVFPVHVQDLLALDGQQSGEHTFTQACAL